VYLGLPIDTDEMKKIIHVVFFLLISASSLHASKIPAADTVKVGVYVISVHDINFHDREYTARFWIWFVYDNPRFDFSKQIDVVNAKDIEQSEMTVDTVDGKFWAQMRLKCTMKENWAVDDFPFDEQHLKIVIEDEGLDLTKMIFVADTVGSRFDNIGALSGWVVDNFHVNTTTSIYSTAFGNPKPVLNNQRFSVFTVEMDIEREARGLFLKIFLGMYFAFLIALVSFLSDTNELEPRFGLPVGGLFAAVGNKYIIDSLLPESSHFSLVDILHNLTFFGIFATLTVSAIALKLHNAGKIQTAHWFNRIGAVVIIITYLIANYIYVKNA
jgi:hypothetical protein